MNPIITWALSIACGIFSLGMISAIGSRRQRRQKLHTHVPVIEKVETILPKKKKNDLSGGVSMAAGGSGNVSAREGEFASISGSSS